MAAYYDTLPKGVRDITYHFSETGTISGNYNSTGDFKGYNINVNINADTIKGLNNAVDAYLATLTPTQYANFSFGTFEGSASSKVTAQALGGGFGITDRLTIYGFLPFYSAEVNLQVHRTAIGRDSSGTLVQIDNLPNVDTRLIQSLIVHYYGYKPIGTWKATNFGDSELGILYQLEKWKNAGLLMKAGVVAPTGRIDDPDTLQDIAFGDGHWDVFSELGGGLNLSKRLSVDSWFRLTYQLPYETKLRLPDSAVFPLTTRAGITKIKMGNMAETNLKLNYNLSDQWGTSLHYIFQYKESDKFYSPYSDSNSILAIDTEKISHIGRINFSYSTLNLFKKKKFIAPLMFNVSAQSIFAGKNIPKYQRADFEITLFF